jgi:hypothetical protein
MRGRAHGTGPGRRDVWCEEHWKFFCDCVSVCDCMSV